MESKSPQAIAQKLSPLEIKNKEFKRAVWGYDPKEVVQFLDETAKMWEKVQKQEKDLLEKVQSLSEEVLKWRGREAEIQKQRERIAQEAEEARGKTIADCQKMYAEVEERAESIRRRTEEWLETIIAQVEETERRRTSFITAFRSALDSHYELLNNDREIHEPLSEQLGQFLKQSMARTEPRLSS